MEGAGDGTMVMVWMAKVMVRRFGVMVQRVQLMVRWFEA